MSKIAKALELAREARRAREEAALRAQPEDRKDDTEPLENGHAMEIARAPARRKPDTGARIDRDVTGQKKSREVIRRMDEVGLMDPQELNDRKIIHQDMGDRRLLNVFRDLRTKLLSIASRKNFRCLITSVVPNGGSSFVTLNLATAFSFDESKTSLIIDCNLRDPEPVLPTASGQHGLTEFLENPEIEPSEIVRHTGIKRLRVVPAGANREIPAEYFSSDRMWEFLEHVKRRYPDRYIFIDGPPATESADVRILSSLCDFVILVVPCCKVTETRIEAAAKTFDRSKLVGVVFNDER